MAKWNAQFHSHQSKAKQHPECVWLFVSKFSLKPQTSNAFKAIILALSICVELSWENGECVCLVVFLFSFFLLVLSRQIT